MHCIAVQQISFATSLQLTLFGHCFAICKSSVLTICRVCPAIPLIHEFHPFGAIALRCSNSFQTNLSTTPASLLSVNHNVNQYVVSTKTARGLQSDKSYARITFSMF